MSKQRELRAEELAREIIAEQGLAVSDEEFQQIVKPDAEFRKMVERLESLDDHAWRTLNAQRRPINA